MSSAFGCRRRLCQAAAGCGAVGGSEGCGKRLRWLGTDPRPGCAWRRASSGSPAVPIPDSGYELGTLGKIQSLCSKIEACAALTAKRCALVSEVPTAFTVSAALVVPNIDCAEDVTVLLHSFKVIFVSITAFFNE
uniref:Uncharacterized protein n=1 Tax=Pipistrellus kuhlii TaxID=59472 RepID=A0A7J7S704_PIPKU|nr:hypothetical protein mPipKuh1_010018 [Pipistrellus kuhlii]